MSALFPASQSVGHHLASAVQYIGPHEVWYEGDLIGVRYHGPINGRDMLGIVRFIAVGISRCGRVYVLVDSNDSIGPDLEARRVMSENGYKDIVGMARFQRGALGSAGFTKLLQNTARLLGRNTTLTAVVETETEARAWLDLLRQQQAL